MKGFYLQTFGLGERRSARVQKLLLTDADLLHVVLQQLLHLQTQRCGYVGGPEDLGLDWALTPVLTKVLYC